MPTPWRVATAAAVRHAERVRFGFAVAAHGFGERPGSKRMSALAPHPA
jgi:hypothetical protein